MFKSALLLGSLVVLLIAGCTNRPVSMQDIKGEDEGTVSEQQGETATEDSETTGDGETADAGWKDVELKDVQTGNTFKISDFSGKPVLLESFAVWCSTCKKQQDQVKKLHKEVGDSVVSVSVDTDPTEDEKKVLQHLERYGYNWLYAVDRGGFAQQLVDEFGLNVVNAPSAPVVLICANQEARLLRFGVKKSQELQTEIEKGCG